MRYAENIHSEPLFRKSMRPVHPEPGIVTAQSYVGRRGHTTRYVIVNEHEPRKKLVRSTTRVPRHYRIADDPGEIVELYPRNIKRYTIRTPHRSHQPHLSEEEEEEEQPGKSVRRGASSQTHHRPRSLSDLHQPVRFYIGDPAGSQVSMAKEMGRGGVYCAHEEDCEEDWDEMASVPRFCSRGNVKGPPEPGHRHFEPQVKPKTKHKVEPSLTESDSASLASSSDQQNSSTDQYIQVIHNKEKYLKTSAKLGKKKSKTNNDVNLSGSSELVCSNV